MITDLDELHLAVIDVEGNGQQPPEIVEIAIVQVDGFRIAAPKTWLVRPSRPITSIVTRKVHGITNTDVATAPTIDELVPEILDVLGDRVPVAHNATVERGVLADQLPDWQPPLILDTMRLAKRLWPDLRSYGLDALIEHASLTIGDEHGTRHRAPYDAYATAKLLVALCDRIDDWNHLVELAGLGAPLPAPRAEGTLW